MNITVYLGANDGNNPLYRQEAERLGQWIARSGHTLVYGGSSVGLMGALARAALKENGRVIGVEPQFFIDRAAQLDGLSELIVTKDMPARKAKLIELGDAFIAFPGGTGTLEEVSEVMSRLALGLQQAPCILFNLGGYYDPLRQLLERMKECGFSDDQRLQRIRFADSLEEIARLLSSIDTSFGA